MKNNNRWIILGLVVFVIPIALTWWKSFDVTAQNFDVSEDIIEEIAFEAKNKFRKPASIAPVIVAEVAPLDLIKKMPLKTKDIQFQMNKKRYPASDVIDDLGNKYRVISDYKIISSDSQDQFQIEKIIEKKFNYLIVKMNEEPSNDFFVVENSQTNQLGIVTGLINVKLTDFDSRDDMASSYDLRITEELFHLNIVTYKVREPSQVFEIAQKMRLQTGVVRVTPEVLETQYKEK